MTKTSVEPRRPRVDAKLYQARVPQFCLNREITPPQTDHVNVVLLCTGESSPEIYAYLDFCRRLTGSSSSSSSSAEAPLEEDEEALAFLHLHCKGKIERAKLMLIAALGGGSSFKAVKDPEKPRAAKSKSAFRVLITDVGSSNASHATNYGLVQALNESTKAVWEQWAGKARKALAAPNAVELVLLLHEARQLPLFRAPCGDETQVSALFDTLYLLESRTKEVEEYLARVHDAISVVRSEDKWTTQELKRLADEGPRKLTVREADILKEMAAECEQWERQAARWLQDGSNTTKGEFTLDGLALFIKEGEASIADHVAQLAALRKREAKCQVVMQRMTQQFKTRKVVTTLPALTLLRDELRRLRLKTDMDDELDKLITAAGKWNEAAKRLLLSASSQAVDATSTLEELRNLVMEAKKLPVDFSGESAQLDKLLTKCEDWQARFSALWPNYAGGEDAVNDLRALPPDTVVELDELLRETLPIIVSEERMLRASMQMLKWSQSAQALLAAPKASLPLSTFERCVEELDALLLSFDTSGVGRAGAPASSRRAVKRAKRSLPLLEFEDQVRSLVQESTAWLHNAQVVCKNGSEDRLSYQTYTEFALQQPQVRVNAALLQDLENQTRKLAQWQHETSTRLDQAQDASARLTESELAQLLQEAGSWGVETPELVRLAEIARELKEWKEQCSHLLISPLATTTTTTTTDGTAAAVAEGGEPKKKQHRHKRSSNVYDRSELQEEDVLRLRQQGMDLCVQVSLAEVDACIQATQEWKSLVKAPLERYWKSRTLPGSQDAAEVVLDGSNSLLQFMRLVNSPDESAFPEEEETAFWREHDLSLEAEDALDEIIHGMQDAEERQLFNMGLNSPEVQASAWLIQADIWLDRVKTEVLEASSGSVTLLQVCQLVYEGLKLVAPPNEQLLAPEHFPESALETYLQGLLPYSKRPKLGAAGMALPSSAISSSVAASTSTPIAASATSLPGTSTAASTTTTSPKDLAEEQFDPWPIFKHIRESNSFEAEGGIHSSMRHDNVTGVMLCRLFGLTRVAQRNFAVRNLVLTVMPRIPRNERTPDALKALVNQAARWTKTLQLQESQEEASLKADWAATEACNAELAKHMGKTAVTIAPIKVLEKLAQRADKLWVDVSLVSELKSTIKACKQWVDSARDTLGGETTQLTTLKRLINEGVEWNKTVDVSQVLLELKQVTDVTCMCRGPRNVNAGAMMCCLDCKEIFHRDCLREFYSTLCPVCFAMRAVNKTIGYGYAAVCRVAALELMDQEIVVDAQQRRDELVQWMKQSRELLMESNPKVDALPEIPAALEQNFEVRAVCDAVRVLSWSFKLEKMRVRPTLQDLEYTLNSAPQAMPAGALAGLESICARGKALAELCAQIWQLPVETESNVVLEQCGKAASQFPTLPLDMASLQREISACIEDKANRHCICHKFDNGRMMFSCVKCELWFHASCVGREDAEPSEDFYCPNCQK